MINDPRRQRIRAVIRDFFRDKPPGTTLERHELDAYYRRLREAAQEEALNCLVCLEPGHASETDDLNRHERCQDGDDSDPGAV